MEQDSVVYEFRMGGEKFIFEAHNPRDAAKYEKYALLHFRERLGERFSERSLEGPFEKDEKQSRKTSA
jgi:hypothetical protein